jgi:hypothetical protein
MSRGGSRGALVGILIVVFGLGGCYAGPGTQTLADAVVEQCDQARAMEALTSAGEAFVAAVERGDIAAAKAVVKQSEDLWGQARSGIHAEPEGSPIPGSFRDRQDALTAARPRFEMFKAVIAASPIEDAAAGTEAMLPEMRALLAAIDVSDCASPAG